MGKSNFYLASRKSKKICFSLLIFLIALVVRAGMVLCGLQDCPQRLLRPDSMTYLIPASSLSKNGIYAGTGRAPGFPLFVSFFCDKEGIFNFPVLVAVLAFINVLTVLPLVLTAKMYLGREKFGSTLFITALFWIFNITAQANSPLLLTDSFFTFFVAWQVYFVVLMWKKGNLYYWLSAAFIAGIAALIRPINVLWIFPLMIIGLTCPNGVSLSKKMTFVVPVLMTFFIVIVPWQLRNASLNAGFTIDTNTGAMCHQNGAMLLAEIKHSDFETEKKQILTEHENLFADKKRFPNEEDRERYRMKKYIELILEHPLIWLKQQFFNWRVLLPDVPTFLELTGNTSPNCGTMGVMAKKGLIAGIKHYFSGCSVNIWVVIALIPFGVMTIIMYLALAYAAIVMFVNIKRCWFDILLFGAFVMYYLWLPGAITAPRYQLPALPWCCCLAAIGVAGIAVKTSLNKTMAIQR